jgi:hypothetical protein
MGERVQFAAAGRALWSASALCLALAACAPAVHLPEPERATPLAYRNAPDAPLPRPSAQWWREFASAELDWLEDTALANNRDHRIAIARVAQAKAQARFAEAQLYPTIDGVARRELYGPEGGPGSVVEGGDSLAMLTPPEAAAPCWIESRISRSSRPCWIRLGSSRSAPCPPRSASTSSRASRSSASGARCSDVRS